MNISGDVTILHSSKPTSELLGYLTNSSLISKLMFCCCCSGGIRAECEHDSQKAEWACDMHTHAEKRTRNHGYTRTNTHGHTHRNICVRTHTQAPLYPYNPLSPPSLYWVGWGLLSARFLHSFSCHIQQVNKTPKISKMSRTKPCYQRLDCSARLTALQYCWLCVTFVLT